MTLPKFEASKDRTCIKCGAKSSETKHILGDPDALNGRPSYLSVVDKQLSFIKRCCTRCGFEWAEAPLDTSNAPKEDTTDQLAIKYNKLIDELVEASIHFAELDTDLTYASCHRGITDHGQVSMKAENCTRCSRILRLREAIKPFLDTTKKTKQEEEYYSDDLRH